MVFFYVHFGRAWAAHGFSLGENMCLKSPRRRRSCKVYRLWSVPLWSVPQTGRSSKVIEGVHVEFHQKSDDLREQRAQV